MKAHCALSIVAGSLAFAPSCPHLETASAVLKDGSALTNATIVAPARPPSSTRMGPPPSGAAAQRISKNTWHGMSRPG
jgi:hypothetical protein